jgi:hypothetical protein
LQATRDGSSMPEGFDKGRWDLGRQRLVRRGELTTKSWGKLLRLVSSTRNPVIVAKDGGIERLNQ